MGLSPDNAKTSNVNFTKQVKGTGEITEVKEVTTTQPINPIPSSNNNFGDNRSTHEVDVMHAGVDTQDFIELSGSDASVEGSQDLLMGDADRAALLMAQLDRACEPNRIKLNNPEGET